MKDGMNTSSANHAISTPKVLIVILNWNSVEETAEAVRAALLTEYPAFSILVIDNGSDPSSHSDLRALQQERVEIVFLEKNRGFTGGSNYGLKAGLDRGFQYVWLFNSDATTPPDTLASLVRKAEATPNVGLVSPRIVASQDPSRELFAGGVYEPAIPSVAHISDPGTIRKWIEEKPEQIVLAGTALLVSTNLVRAIGYFDDTFFAYWEDMDYSVRSLETGFRNVIDFDSAIQHFDKFGGSHPVQLKPHWYYYMMRNEIFFWKKHARGKKKLQSMVWVYRKLLAEVAAKRHDAVSSHALCAGAWDGYLGRSGPYSASRRMPAPVTTLVVSMSRR